MRKQLMELGQRTSEDALEIVKNFPDDNTFPIHLKVNYGESGSCIEAYKEDLLNVNSLQV